MQIIPITSIVVLEDRQRKVFSEAQMEELSESIFQGPGLMNPLLLRPGDPDDGTYFLVAGERRLRVLTQADKEYKFGDETIPAGHAPAVIKMFSSAIDVEEAELHENTVRMNLTWQERVTAVTRLHEYKLRRNPDHKIGQTAALLADEQSLGKGGGYAPSSKYQDVNRSILVKDFLHDPKVSKAANLQEAARIVSHKIEEDLLKRMQKIPPPESSPRPPSEGLPNLTQEASLPSLSNVTAKYSGRLLIGPAEEKLAEVKTGSVTVVISDPPYGVNADKFKDGGKAWTASHNYSDDWDYAEKLMKYLIQEFDRVCAESAHIYMFCDIRKFFAVSQMFSDSWKVRDRPIIWSKGVGKLSGGTAQGYSSSYECILFAQRGTRPCAKVMPDVLSQPPVRDRVHAAQKPADLYKIFLAMSALPGDLVLDPTCGVGTIFTAANALNIEAIGIELSEDYVAYAQEARRTS